MHKTVLAFGILALVCLSNASEQLQEQSDDIPKLPLYVGLGYNLIKGNPLGKFIDTGFAHPIINFTYKNNKTTSDNRYVVPDNVISRVVSSCSFETDVKEHRGTESYQKSIFETVGVRLETQTKIFSSAFSTSSSWKKVQNETITEQKSITMAGAQCEAYYLSIDLFDFSNHFSLDQSFVNAVNTSFHSNNWDSFFLEYGTHFIESVTMGGKAVQQITYTSRAVSELSSLDIDIQHAAKARFAIFFGDKSFDWQKYENQAKYTKELTNQTSQIYIGGQPPKDGNVRTWVDSVLNNPMPIRYQLIQMSHLFDKIEALSIKLIIKQIKQSFLNASNIYCQKSGCTIPTPDKPKPLPAKIEVVNAEAAGIPVGNVFEWKMPVPLINLQKILVDSGSWIDGIQLLMTDKVTSVYSPYFGIGVGHQWVVPTGEEISQVEYWNDNDKLQGFNLITNKGNKSPIFGRTLGAYTLVTFPAGYRVIGIYGYAGSFVARFGFILGRTTFSSSEQSDKYEEDTVKLELA